MTAANTEVEVTVVIPVKDGAAGLRSTLDALSAQDGAPPFEVIVVDNGSSDSSAATAEAHSIVTRVLSEHRRGPYAARNTGIAAARGRIVALTDADCLPWPAWLSSGVAAIDGGADLVGGHIRQRSTTDHPSRWERYDRAMYLRQAHFVAVDHFAATANLFVKAEVLAAIGAFRPELVASGDVEFGQRATAQGYTLEYDADAGVDHQPRSTMADTWRLHRKLGSGFAELAKAGLREPLWKDQSLRIPLSHAVEVVASDGPRVRFRHLWYVHGTVMAARWTGRLTGRG
jgi:glycosyltransferase involved in cell wall biosynthesis